MKWGVRKDKDRANRRDRVIRKGTSIQNISKGEMSVSDRRIYGSHTEFDNNSYSDEMGNFMYNGRNVFQNKFKVKKDISIPSDQKLVDTFMDTVKRDPKQVAKDLSKAYNSVHMINSRTARMYEKKLSKLNSESIRKNEKLTKEFIANTPMSKSSQTSFNIFVGSLSKQGYNAISDVNDRDGNREDPLIILNPSKSLNLESSVKLTRAELDYYSKYTSSKQHKQTRIMGKRGR